MSDNKEKNSQKKEEKAVVVAYEIKSNTYPLITDVYGTPKFKQDLEDIVLGVEAEMLYYMFGVQPPKSFLFYGPPGTGKTLTANAIANTIATADPDRKTYFMPYNIGELGTAYINMGAVNLQKFFDTGYELALKQDTNQVVYWFDECDSIMSQRQSGGHKEDDKLLNCLMQNLQTINDRGTPESVFLATNFKDSIDPASIRSGRISQKLEFKLPDFDTRQAVFEGVISERNRNAQYNIIRNYDVGDLARRTDGMSHSDITSSVETAISNKIKSELRTLPEVIPAYYITQKWINDAIDEIRTNNTPVGSKIGFIHGK